MAEPRSVRVALWAMFASVILIASGPLLATLGVLPSLAALGLFVAGIAVSLVALLAGVRGIRRSTGRSRIRAQLATGYGAVTFAVALAFFLVSRRHPPINDITTNPIDPPRFKQADPKQKNLEYPAQFAEVQRSAYPDLLPIHSRLAPPQAVERAQKTAEALGWKLVESYPNNGGFQATDTSVLFRFVDDIALRVRVDGSGSLIDLRSKSRDGRGDMGVNAARIRAFHSAFAAGE